MVPHVNTEMSLNDHILISRPNVGTLNIFVTEFMPYNKSGGGINSIIVRQMGFFLAQCRWISYLLFVFGHQASYNIKYVIFDEGTNVIGNTNPH